MKKGQMSDTIKVFLGGGLSLLILFMLYTVVSLTEDRSGGIEEICHPQWHIHQTTRALLQTETGNQPLRQTIGEAITEEGVSQAHNVIRDTVNKTTRLNWFWTIDGQRGGSPGIATDVTGAQQSANILNDQNPVSYEYRGRTVSIKAVAIDVDDPC